MPEKLLLHSVLKLENIVKKQKKIAIACLELNFCPTGPLHSKCYQKTADIGFEDFTSLWFCKHSQKGHRENDPKPFYATVGPLGFLLSSREAKTQWAKLQ